ncbi:sensor histidine kinase [Nocardioides marmoriginsengisoli]|uniref:histidine kinase n=1 Tax=Nocardioides marmoriginsengisoli TaxID=661483 RepID=A0A3N0CP35_9ACTN|nr:sensor domain-containing protein [Nocardioides marmoriginsengisoli]RNL65089.1 sensor histidine kinase [Nocardioides marmoriginsengisoli]
MDDEPTLEIGTSADEVVADAPGAVPWAPPGRFKLTLYAGAHLLMVLPTLLFFVLSVVGGVLSIAWVGLPVLFLFVPASRWIATRHRNLAAAILGTPVPADYRPVPEGTHLPNRIAIYALDPMTWRDLAWMLVSLTAGFVLSLLTFLLLVVIVTGALWWYGAEPIMRARARLDRALLSYGTTDRLEQRVQVLTETRASSIDHSAAEMRRIERDLHDGAQARLVAVGMSLGLAESLFETDPERAQQLVSDARAATSGALGDLRSVVRGIHPPVLADRGIGGAVEALALDMPIPVTVMQYLPGRPPAPVESAMYFAVAECLANVGKHSGAQRAWVDLRHADGVLTAKVGDDGAGGADPARGTGMTGVMRRLSAFDGTMRVSSPERGPTLITLEVPCALSSPKTTPSSPKG